MQSQTGYKILLFLNGRNLKDLDFFSKSDPYAKVFFKKDLNSNLKLIGKTQTIQNQLNPNWKTTFQLDYIFEISQKISFEIMDEDQKYNDQLIGKAETSLGAIVGAQNQTSILVLKNSQGKQCGKLIVRCEKVQESNLNIQMKWRAVNLMNTDSWFDFWDKSDPYLKFLKIRKDNTYVQIASTEVIQNNLNPNWKLISIPLNRLVSETQTKFKVQCWDQQQEKSKHQFIGQVFLDLNDLRKFNGAISFKLNNKAKANPGTIILQSFKQVAVPTFIDYLRGNLQLNLITAIDFTASNGYAHNPQSLHYLNPIKPNQYQTTLGSIWNIIENYDYDKKIPAFAFGAIPKFPYFNQPKVNHCFPLSGDFNQLEAFGFDNFMQIYVNALKHVEFSGPTYFAPLIRQTFKLAQHCKNTGQNVYQVLLILTDGQIHDMSQTVDLIVSGSTLPISIIIVGVGNADFTNMQTLDGDNGLYDSKNRRCTRDLVQFVPFRQYSSNPVALTEQVLKQLPKQVVQYMKIIGKPPNPPQIVDVNNLVEAKINFNLINKIVQMPVQSGQQSIIKFPDYPQQ